MYHLEYCDLGHHHEKIRLFQSQLLNLVLVVSGFALEDYLLGLRRETLLTFQTLLESTNLNKSGRTVSVGYISIEKISPFRFLILIFILEIIN
jgi:hypothetical protein